MATLLNDAPKCKKLGELYKVSDQEIKNWSGFANRDLQRIIYVRGRLIAHAETSDMGIGLIETESGTTIPIYQ